MARPRKLSDDDLLNAVATLLSEAGPGALTFSAASAATGLSPAALVQRYGNREALLQAALLWMWDRLDEATAAADAEEAISPAGAIAMLLRLSGDYEAGDEHGQGLLLLREDFRDPVLRARGAAWQVALGAALGRRLGSDGLGRLMATQWQGAVLWWGFARDGSLHAYLERELRDWLAAVGG